MIEQKVRDFLYKHNINKSVDRLLVAFSGGSDSLTLLNIINNLQKDYNFKLFAVHVNHQWRKEENLQEEQFVRSFCGKLNIPVFIEKLDKDLPKTELIAREKRYEIFNKVAIANKINILLTAHNKSDQAETVLYRLIKGTGLNGLCGIPEKRSQENGPAIYRPLLTTTRCEIEEYIKQHNLKPCTDSSNFDETFLRNRIRHSLIPELKSYNNQIEEALVRLANLSVDNELAMNQLLGPCYQKVFVNDDEIITKEFLDLPDYLKPRIIIKLLDNHKIDYDYALIERLIDFIKDTELSHAGKKTSLIKNLFLHITQKSIKIISSEADSVIKSSATVQIPGITELKELNLKLKVSEYTDQNITDIEFPASDSDKAFVDLTNITDKLELRTRNPGDIINPLGITGHMKLKKYLINNHIPQNEKDSIPLIAQGNEVLWLVGQTISNKIKVQERPTHVFEIIRG